MQRKRIFGIVMAVPLIALTSYVRADVLPAGSGKATGVIEVGVSHQSLTSGYPDWNGSSLRGVLQPDAANVWNWELTRQSEFHDRGSYFALGDTHTFSPDSYGSFTVGSSSGGFFYPRLRADAFLNHKWGRRRQLVSSVGLGYYEAKDSHHDTSLSLGAIYYAAPQWIVEGGVRLNNSSPGSVNSLGQFLAVTQGRDRHHYLILRLGAGHEAYELIGPSSALVNFPSQELSLTWRQWLSRDWGFTLGGGYYRNSAYRRTGVTVGSFKSF